MLILELFLVRRGLLTIVGSTVSCTSGYSFSISIYCRETSFSKVENCTKSPVPARESFGLSMLITDDPRNLSELSVISEDYDKLSIEFVSDGLT